MKNKQSGFSLVELAVVLAIIGIISAGAFLGMKAQRDLSKFSESESKLQQLKQSLLTFVLVNGHLPCPDTDDDGEENLNGVACSANNGKIPFIDLGLSGSAALDSWGSSIYYAIDRDATNAVSVADSGQAASYFHHNGTSPTFNLNTPPNQSSALGGLLRVCNDSATNCNAATSAAEVSADRLSALLVAFNRNGIATWNNCNNAIVDERENCDNDAFFAQKLASEVFDDLLITISAYEIKATFLKNNPTKLP